MPTKKKHIPPQTPTMIRATLCLAKAWKKNKSTGDYITPYSIMEIIDICNYYGHYRINWHKTYKTDVKN